MVAAGNIRYNLGTAPVTGAGLEWTDAELTEAIEDRVASLVFDDQGREDLAAQMAALAETDFEKAELERILSGPSQPVENWRVGEAIAEAYLSDHKGCRFPWPDARDERRNGSSLPGADLVGFQRNPSGVRFAFGEVKTSAEEAYPPQVLTGRKGLQRQIEDLRDRAATRDALFKYLGHRSKNAAWKEDYETAGKRYLRKNDDVQLFGVLIRDVPPQADDLRLRVERLSDQCPEATNIELLSIYLPNRCIVTLADRAHHTRGAR